MNHSSNAIVRIATRSSLQARTQAQAVADALVAAAPGTTVELVFVETTGDQRQDVPLHTIGAFMTDLPATVSAVDPAAHTWLFGHVADGNLHVNITGHRADDAAQVHALEGAVLERVVALGGCISAEHGIGVLKAPWLHLDRSPDEIATMRAIKHALDPDGVLNPGVLFEEDR